ncbi:hypothetical protein WH96_19800 [Kiloniella spongiae]|uniref:N-acetyltransferase domain-containing protein n=1 Tax=Kiloniella spongiae TaxID=1489064 RepID=A0A0H2MQS3_9PROT|nr:hypothetical protein [Kiloniella spongiae]KLN59020.1 hypothetical protein WH96_19800 [Kiloniella spongiae]
MSKLDITVVSSIDEWVQCQHIRSSAFLSTEPYREEFDGKDFELVTHILAIQDTVPVACMRLRYACENTIHGGRLALMPNLEPRNRLRTLNAIATYADSYCVKMGFSRILGEVADRRLIKFWLRRGFQLTGGKPIEFGDRQFWPIEKYINGASILNSADEVK